MKQSSLNPLPPSQTRRSSEKRPSCRIHGNPILPQRSPHWDPLVNSLVSLNWCWPRMDLIYSERELDLIGRDLIKSIDLSFPLCWCIYSVLAKASTRLHLIINTTSAPGTPDQWVGWLWTALFRPIGMHHGSPSSARILKNCKKTPQPR